ncbi:MAG TPA: hypothetical protein VGB73_01110 [Pyrinomonadaceae bacterium]|jgi:hypothetical protein
MSPRISELMRGGLVLLVTGRARESICEYNGSGRGSEEMWDETVGGGDEAEEKRAGRREASVIRCSRLVAGLDN